MTFPYFEQSMIIILICTILYEVRQWYLGDASRFWKTTTGTILKADIKSTTDMEGDDSHEPRVTYSYRLNGIVHKSKRISYGRMWSNDYSEATDALQGKFENKQITVYYDPTKPGRSVLHPGASLVPKILIPVYIAGIVYLLLNLSH